MQLHELSATDLRRRLEAGETTSVAIIEALIARAAITEPHVRGFTQRLHTEALGVARERDAERARGQLRGPLHGLPFTVKENLDVRGATSSVGLAHSQTAAAREDAVIVGLAKAAGAICLGKSNVPQALLSMRCDNDLYGRTYNPWSGAHVTGGSSSGEAALIASGASVMGFGSDLGGSIRFPAAFCGVAGFKPTQDLWSNRGAQTAIRGQEFVRAQLGPMARSAEDLALLWRALPAYRQHAQDGRVPPLHPTPSERPLRVGYFEDDGVTLAQPAMRRAVREAADHLRAAGVEVVPFTPLHRDALVALYLAAVSSDGMATLRSRFGAERPERSTRLMWALGSAPSVVRSAIAAGLRVAGERSLSRIVAGTGQRDVADFWRLADHREQLRVEEERAWNDAAIDALLCPASATPAVPVGMEHDASLIFSHYCVFNIFGMPAGVVPVTRVRRSETTVAAGPEQLDKRLAAIAARSEGLPVGVQVAGRCYADQDVIRLLGLIEAGARRSDAYPVTPVTPLAG